MDHLSTIARPCDGLREFGQVHLKKMGPLTFRRASQWGPTLVINVVALSLASYLALVYQSAMTRRILAE